MYLNKLKICIKFACYSHFAVYLVFDITASLDKLMTPVLYQDTFHRIRGSTLTIELWGSKTVESTLCGFDIYVIE